MRHLRSCISGLLLTCVVGNAGCSKGPAAPTFELVPASGTVTLDGKPLTDADVSLVFQSPPPAGFSGSGGRTDASGKFQVLTDNKPGTIVGKFKVMVSKQTMADGSPIKTDPTTGLDMEQLKMQGQLKENVPEKYTVAETTDLTADVAKGGKEIELKLTSQ
ncbi:MAG: hypothetical protein HZA46_07745 [Planctomycetales bacterium]|nr:hypothetical protein [Planctomycetales bacterium]